MPASMSGRLAPVILSLSDRNRTWRNGRERRAEPRPAFLLRPGDSTMSIKDRILALAIRSPAADGVQRNRYPALLHYRGRSLH
jgi:hypothetical protein